MRELVPGECNSPRARGHQRVPDWGWVGGGKGMASTKERRQRENDRMGLGCEAPALEKNLCMNQKL